MLGALETSYSADRLRCIVASRLNRRPRDLEIHRAILRLAQLRRVEGTRLVATNFDICPPSAPLGHFDVIA